MTATTMPQQKKEGRSALERSGVIVLLVGALGVAVWAAMALFSASYGSAAADTVAGQMAAVGVEDPVNEPDVWVGRDNHGTVVFEGTRDELDALVAEGRSADQADLRRDWLYPSLVISAVGLVLFGVGRLRREQPVPDE